MEKFQASDFVGKGISELPDEPDLGSPAMQQKFDELTVDVVAPKFNTLVDLLASSGGAAEIGSAGSGVQADLSALQNSVSLKAAAADVLLKDNAASFAPTGDYQPATKKYVDDTLVAIGAGDMAKSVYDSDADGTVNAADNGAFEYAHAKSGTVHALTRAGDMHTQIAFTATDDFAADDTFTLNGAAVSAKQWSGAALPGGYFSAGTRVNCVAGGSALYFANSFGLRRLWSGTWSSGALSVPGISEYFLLLVRMAGTNNTSVGIGHIINNVLNAHFSGYAGSSSASNMTYTLHATLSGDVLTASELTSMVHSSSGSHSADIAAVVCDIYGLVRTDQLI